MTFKKKLALAKKLGWKIVDDSWIHFPDFRGGYARMMICNWEPSKAEIKEVTP